MMVAKFAMEIGRTAELMFARRWRLLADGVGVVKQSCFINAFPRVEVL
jgi:hypothetical protein